MWNIFFFFGFLFCLFCRLCFCRLANGLFHIKGFNLQESNIVKVNTKHIVNSKENFFVYILTFKQFFAAVFKANGENIILNFGIGIVKKSVYNGIECTDF